MAYLALYRKYRPQTFEEIMGQEHVTRTLQNAIRQGHVAHAYLFCGPRGTAKTTTARVLAKAMNCEHGPTPEPDDTCDACVRIREGHSLDVVEIDAASNRGIDDIKLLREQIGRASAQERYKFYIIDEVHQLSADAFQALLKTLEEPPPNVIFVLATTETHRVPKTIVSRCQRFDFRRGTMKDLSDRLQFVADREGMVVEPEALSAIARAAAGGWRDALSLFEQISAFSPEKIDAAAVHAVLGSVEDAALFRLTDALASGDSAVLFRDVESLVGDGKEPRQLLSTLGAHLRDLLWVQSGAEDAAGLSPEMAAKYREQAGRVPAPLLMRALDAIQRAESQMRWVSDHRLMLELTLLKIAHGGSAPQSESLLQPASSPAPAARTAPPASAARTPRKAAPPEPAPQEEWDDAPEPKAPDAPPDAPLPAKASAKPAAKPSPAPEEPSAEDYASPEESIEGGLDEIWTQVIAKVKPSVRAILKSGTPLGISGKTFRVGFAFPSHIGVLERKDNKEQVEKVLKTLTGMDLRVKGEPGDASGNGNSSPSASASGAASDSTSNSFLPSAPKAPPYPENVSESSPEYVTDAEFAQLFNAEKIDEGDS